MPSSRRCAYCGLDTGPLTREHLWPAGIIGRANVKKSFFGKIEKYLDVELTIKDVCAKCNNGPLSALDSYACTLYDAQFSRQAVQREARTFVYDYVTLVRWLLKMSFNSARANASDVDVLSAFTPLIVYGGVPPHHVQVRLELIHPSTNPNWKPGSESTKEIPAATIRCARVAMPENPLPGTTVRLVAINSYYFWLTVTPPEADTGDLHARLPGKLLLPNLSKLSLYPTRGMLELHSDWLSNQKGNQSMRALRARK